jgi:hypothetical protein
MRGRSAAERLVHLLPPCASFEKGTAKQSKDLAAAMKRASEGGIELADDILPSKRAKGEEGAGLEENGAHQRADEIVDMQAKSRDEEEYAAQDEVAPGPLDSKDAADISELVGSRSKFEFSAGDYLWISTWVLPLMLCGGFGVLSYIFAPLPLRAAHSHVPLCLSVSTAAAADAVNTFREGDTIQMLQELKTACEF